MSEERRLYPANIELRIVEDGEQTRIEGLAVPYNALSEDLGGFRERVMPGAFSGSLEARSGREDLIADIEHDRNRLLARASKGTLRFWEEGERGIMASITVPDTTLGRDSIEMVKAGLYDGMSIAFAAAGVVDRFLRDGEEVIRELVSATLRGVTLTSSPAYRQTVDTLAFRSLEQFQKEYSRSNTTNRRRRIELAKYIDQSVYR